MTDEEWAALLPFAETLAAARNNLERVTSGENADPVLAIRYRVEVEEAEDALRIARHPVPRVELEARQKKHAAEK